MTVAAPQQPDTPKEIPDHEQIELQGSSTNEVRADSVTPTRAPEAPSRSSRTITRPARFNDYVTY